MDEQQKPGAIVSFVRRRSSFVLFYGYIELPNHLRLSYNNKHPYENRICRLYLQSDKSCAMGHC